MTKVTKIATPTEELARLMKVGAVTQAGLVRMCLEAGHKIGKASVSEILSGTTKPGLDTAKAFAAVFGVSPVLFMPELADLVQAAAAPAPVPETPAAAEDPSVRRVSILRIKPSPLNPRRTFEPEALKELADSIAAQGLLQNLVVRPVDPDNENTSYHIVAGERRYRALEILFNERRAPAEIREHGVPCRIVTIDDAQHVALALLENLQRKDVNPMEEAEAFAKLQALDPAKWTTAHIAEQIGMTQRHVQLRMALASKLSDPVKDALKQGKITLAAARVMAMTPPAQQKKLLADAPHYTAERLRERATNNMVPVGLASFPLEGCGLEIIEEPGTGHQFFADKKAFTERQRKAAEDKVAELKATWDWVRLETYFYAGNYETGGTGAIVEFREYSGSILVHEGLKPKKQSAGAARDEARQKARNAFWDERGTTAKCFGEDLAAKLTFPDALILLLAEQAAGSMGPLSHMNGLPSFITSAGGLAPLTRFFKQNSQGNAEMRDNVEWSAVLTGFDKVPDLELQLAIATMVGARLMRNSSHGELHPVALLYAERYGISVPPILLVKHEQIDSEIARRAKEAPQQLDIEDAIDAVAGAAA
jgi:ParB family transcriptional regulator, chromosome partitioning protein